MIQLFDKCEKLLRGEILNSCIKVPTVDPTSDFRDGLPRKQAYIKYCLMSRYTSHRIGMMQHRDKRKHTRGSWHSPTWQINFFVNKQQPFNGYQNN